MSHVTSIRSFRSSLSLSIAVGAVALGASGSLARAGDGRSLIDYKALDAAGQGVRAPRTAPIYPTYSPSGPEATFTYDINLAGYAANGDFTDVTNTLSNHTLLPNAYITGVEWINLNFDTFNGSYRSEFVLSTNNSANTGAAGTFWDHSPAPTLNSSGNYTGSGAFTNPSNRFSSGPFQLLPDGVLTVYVWDSFDDTGNDETVNSGTLRITYSDVPPPPPPAPTVAATITLSDTSLSYATADATVTKIGGGVTWYKVVVPAGGATASNGIFVDIDTEGAATSTGASFDTEIGLYTSGGVLIASDDDSGSGPTSQLTFGDTTPRGPLTTTPATTAGLAANGADGNLVAGEYYLAVAGFNAAFGGGFGVTTNSTDTSATIPVNFRTNLPAVPEPTTLAALGVAGVLGLARRRR